MLDGILKRVQVYIEKNLHHETGPLTFRESRLEVSKDNPRTGRLSIDPAIYTLDRKMVEVTMEAYRQEGFEVDNVEMPEREGLAKQLWASFVAKKEEEAYRVRIQRQENTLYTIVISEDG